jgi:hypothetical protein
MLPSRKKEREKEIVSSKGVKFTKRDEQILSIRHNNTQDKTFVCVPLSSNLTNIVCLWITIKETPPPTAATLTSHTSAAIHLEEEDEEESKPRER